MGNVRLSFTSKEEVETTTATYETANLNTEQSQFVRMDNAKRINSSLFDRTNGVAPTTTSGHAQRLNGTTNERYGIARSISVMPGDVIDAEVYAKYIDTNSSNWTTALANLVSQINANTAGVVIDGAQYTNSTATFPASMLGHQTTTNNGAPRAYLNWLVFDRNYVFVTGGFKQITTAARETGTDIAHEKLQMPAPITITQPGYVYIYLSNENTTQVEVFFDEFKVTHTKSPVIQTDDYYPFGLAFNSYSRENSTPNQYLYNGKERQDELGLEWLDYGARMYMPELGRWGVVDPLAEVTRRWSPYTYVYDNPLVFIDPDGRLATYNWSTGQYEDGGNVVSWDYVQNQINSGAYDQEDPKKKKENDKREEDLPTTHSPVSEAYLKDYDKFYKESKPLRDFFYSEMYAITGPSDDKVRMEKTINRVLDHCIRMGPNGTVQLAILLSQEDMLNSNQIPQEFKKIIRDGAKDKGIKEVLEKFLTKGTVNKIMKGSNVFGKILDPIPAGPSADSFNKAAINAYKIVLIRVLFGNEGTPPNKLKSEKLNNDY